MDGNRDSLTITTTDAPAVRQLVILGHGQPPDGCLLLARRDKLVIEFDIMDKEQCRYALAVFHKLAEKCQEFMGV
jgi:hypothetical protein